MRRINDSADSDFSRLEMFHGNFTEYKLVASAEPPLSGHSTGLFHQPTLLHNFLYSLTICLLHYYPRHVSSINMPIFRNCALKLVKDIILFYVFITIYNSLHVSSTSCSSSGETNCINTASGNSHSMLVAEMSTGWCTHLANQHRMTVTRRCIDTICLS